MCYKDVMTNDITFRLEEKKDYRAVENLIRESFWNVYLPGCSKHYVIHVLRYDPAFVKELDFVMEKDGVLIGRICSCVLSSTQMTAGIFLCWQWDRSAYLLTQNYNRNIFSLEK